MSVAEVHDLNKTYPAFALKRASFSIEEGRITGFIGRNGAGNSLGMRGSRPLDVRVRRRGKGFFRFLA